MPKKISNKKRKELLQEIVRLSEEMGLYDEYLTEEQLKAKQEQKPKDPKK